MSKITDHKQEVDELRRPDDQGPVVKEMKEDSKELDFRVKDVLQDSLSKK